MNDGLVDLHVHSKLPVLGGWWGRSLQGFDLDHMEDQSIYLVSFYDFAFPTSKRAYSRLIKDIGSFRSTFHDSILENHDDLKKNKKFILGIESARTIPEPDKVEELFDLGVRSIQPLHFWDNQYGHSCRDGVWSPSSKGLTDRGRVFLKKMDALEMILDLAHMNLQTMEDALNVYSGSVMCSHTGVFSLRAVHRNIHDSIASEIMNRGGVIGVTPWKHLMPRSSDWIESFCKTILRLVELGGEKGVCLGSDRGAPIQVSSHFFSKENLSQMDRFFQKRGCSSSFMNLLLRGNAIEFLKKNLS